MIEEVAIVKNGLTLNVTFTEHYRLVSQVVILCILIIVIKRYALVHMLLIHFKPCRDRIGTRCMHHVSSFLLDLFLAQLLSIMLPRSVQEQAFDV